MLPTFSEKLGQVISKPGLSCEHVLEHGIPVGDREYWIDIENDGDPIKVFCDMTTDAGKNLTHSFQAIRDWAYFLYSGVFPPLRRVY